MKKYWDIVRNYFPIFGLVLVVVVFGIITKGAILSTQNLQSMLNQMMLTALVSLGSVFIFGCGCFDMSMGGTVCMSAVLGGYVGVATGNIFLMALTCFVVALLLNVIKGIFATYVEVPLFIVTIVLGFILGALVLVIMGSKTTLYLNEAANPVVALNQVQLTILNIAALGFYLLLCIVLFNYTRLGREVKLLGGNPITFRQTGLSEVKVKVLSFVIGAIGVALAAFVLLMRTRTVGATTAGSMGTDVMVALVLGGMPLTGGPRSRISAGIVGAATITILNAGLTMAGLGLAAIQVCRAIIYLVVVYVASMTYRTKLLPR